MAINPNIPLSYQAPQMADPLNKMFQIEQLKAARQNALIREREAALAERALESENALRKLYSSGQPVSIEQAIRIGGMRGAEMYKNISAAKEAEFKRVKSQTDALTNRLKLGREMLGATPDTAEGYKQFYDSYVSKNPDLADYFSDPAQYKPGRGGTIEKLRLSADQILSDRRAQETLSSQVKQNLFNQINAMSSRVFKVTPEGVPVVDPVAQARLAQLTALAAQQYPDEYVQFGLGAAPAEGVLAQPVGAGGVPAGTPDAALASLVTGRGDLGAGGLPSPATGKVTEIAEARATQAGAKKSAELKAQSEQDKKSNISMASQMLNFIGYKEPKEGEAQQESRVERLIRDSTSGALQAKAAGAFGALTGTATEGMEKIGELKQLETTLTKDFLGGKLGGGISDADRAMISQMIAEIGNPEIPENQRRAGFKSLINVLTTIKSQGYYLQPKTVADEQPSASGGGDGVDLNNPLLQ